MANLSDLFEDLGLPWHFATKERLSEGDVYSGLIDHGLFADKIPPCFTTAGLGVIVSDQIGNLLDQDNEGSLKTDLNKRCHDYIRYESLRDINIPRNIGIPHPEAYAVQSLAIQKHWKEIATHCNRPSPSFSRIHVRPLSSGAIFEMNYKGPERYKHEEEELVWMSYARYVVKTDIKSCFPSIYTHSIPWALHGKSEAKTDSSLSGLFGNLLDKCTQNTKDRQTNGILIGPHTSSIISEIILTSIDVGLQECGYSRVVRRIDDYEFYAADLQEAEAFVRSLGILLRDYEMSLNEKKTEIIELPTPSIANWVQALNRHPLPKEDEITFRTVRSLLDLALELSGAAGKSTPINYAIKMLAGHEGRLPLNARAKRLYAQEAINLALAYPYIAPLLGKHVFERYWFDGLEKQIEEFIPNLINIGIRKLYPDPIAHGIFYALKYEVDIKLDDAALCEIVKLDDCITNVLLHEYAIRQGVEKVSKAIAKRATEIKKLDTREKDRNWLLIYQLWSEAELKGNGQGFLSTLKKAEFSFLNIPAFKPVTTETA